MLCPQEQVGTDVGFVSPSTLLHNSSKIKSGSCEGSGGTRSVHFCPPELQRSVIHFLARAASSVFGMAASSAFSCSGVILIIFSKCSQDFHRKISIHANGSFRPFSHRIYILEAYSVFVMPVYSLRAVRHGAVAWF